MFAIENHGQYVGRIDYANGKHVWTAHAGAACRCCNYLLMSYWADKIGCRVVRVD